MFLNIFTIIQEVKRVYNDKTAQDKFLGGWNQAFPFCFTFLVHQWQERKAANGDKL